MMTNAVLPWQKVVLEHFPVVLNPSYELLNKQADLPLLFLSNLKVQYSVMLHVQGHYSGSYHCWSGSIHHKGERGRASSC